MNKYHCSDIFARKTLRLIKGIFWYPNENLFSEASLCPWWHHDLIVLWKFCIFPKCWNNWNILRSLSEGFVLKRCQYNILHVTILWSHLGAYERVAIGRKYPCTRPLWICLLWELLQSLFHVQIGWNLSTKQSLYVQHFCLWPDENPLAWSGAIHHQKNAIILAVNTAIYMVKVGLARS